MGKRFTYLLYLRFDDQGKVVTMHIVIGGGVALHDCLRMTEQRGFTPTQKLQEYAYFLMGGVVKDAVTPNFHFYYSEEFKRRWELGGQPVVGNS